MSRNLLKIAQNAQAFEEISSLIANDNEILNLMIEDMQTSVCLIGRILCNLDDDTKKEAINSMEALSIHQSKLKRLKITE